MFPAYAAAPAGLQVDTQMEEKTRWLWSNDSLYLFLCCPHVWEQSTYVARLGFRYSQCHGCFLKNSMCWVPFVCVFQNTCAHKTKPPGWDSVSTSLCELEKKWGHECSFSQFVYSRLRTGVAQTVQMSHLWATGVRTETQSLGWLLPAQ